MAATEEAVMARPEGASMAEALGQPRCLHERQAVHLPEQLRPLTGEAAPDRLIALAEMELRLMQIPPALGPGQRFSTAAQPHLPAQQRLSQLTDLFRRPSALRARRLRSHGDQLDFNGNAAEGLEMAGGAAIAEQQQPPGPGETHTGRGGAVALQHIAMRRLPEGMGGREQAFRSRGEHRGPRGNLPRYRFKCLQNQYPRCSSLETADDAHAPLFCATLDHGTVAAGGHQPPTTATDVFTHGGRGGAVTNLKDR
jgi:hypothetical protein